MAPPLPKDVAAAIDTYPDAIRSRVMMLRELIFATAAGDPRIGPLTESLKWGEPAYLPKTPRIGTTVRIAWKKVAPHQFGMYVHCQTNLVDTFRSLFPDQLKFDGNRAVISDEDGSIRENAMAFCISAALAYHLNKKSAA